MKNKLTISSILLLISVIGFAQKPQVLKENTGQTEKKFSLIPIPSQETPQFLCGTILS